MSTIINPKLNKMVHAEFSKNKTPDQGYYYEPLKAVSGWCNDCNKDIQRNIQYNGDV